MQQAIRYQHNSEILFYAIKEKPPLSKKQRLLIYQEAYRIRLTECLHEDFTETAQKLGVAAFEETVDDYIHDVSTRCTQLAEYSEGFVEYMGIKHPQLYEMASKEWMEILSWRAIEPEEKLSLEEMQSNVPYLLKVHPSLKTKKLFNKILVSHRSNEEIHFFEVNKKQLVWLNFFSEARSMASLCDFFEAQHSQVLSEEPLEQDSRHSEEEDTAMLVQQWIQNGVVYCIRLQP